MKAVRKFLPGNRYAVVTVVTGMVEAVLIVTSANIVGKYIIINESKNKKQSSCRDESGQKDFLPGNRNVVTVVMGMVAAVLSVTSANITGKHININDKKSSCRDESVQRYILTWQSGCCIGN